MNLREARDNARRVGKMAAQTAAITSAAVLLTAAGTSPDQPSAFGAATVDNVLYIGQLADDGFAPAGWIGSGNLSRWSFVLGSDGIKAGLPTVATANLHRMECVDGAPNTCFRAVRDRLAVERSDDAGATWTIEWEVPDTQRDQLEAALPHLTGIPSDLATRGVAVIGDAEGYTVVAANGRDGFATRREAGAWTREGFLGASCCEDIAVVELSDTIQPRAAIFAVPAPVVLGLIAALIAMVLVSESSRRPDPRKPWRYVFGIPGAILGFSALALLVPLSLTRSYEDASSGTTVILAVTVAVIASALILNSLARVHSPGEGRWAPAYAFAGAVGLVAGLASWTAMVFAGAPTVFLSVGATTFIGMLVFGMLWAKARGWFKADPHSRSARALLGLAEPEGASIRPGAEAFWQPVFKDTPVAQRAKKPPRRGGTHRSNTEGDVVAEPPVETPAVPAPAAPFPGLPAPVTAEAPTPAVPSPAVPSPAVPSPAVTRSRPFPLAPPVTQPTPAVQPPPPPPPPPPAQST